MSSLAAFDAALDSLFHLPFPIATFPSSRTKVTANSTWKWLESVTSPRRFSPRSRASSQRLQFFIANFGCTFFGRLRAESHCRLWIYIRAPTDVVLLHTFLRFLTRFHDKPPSESFPTPFRFRSKLASLPGKLVWSLNFCKHVAKLWKSISMFVTTSETCGQCDRVQRLPSLRAGAMDR